ncbi:MAG: HAD-IIA family hydrolase [Candidatus Hodarchaeales archaeon]
MSQLNDKRYLLFDCDGVVWRGKEPIKGAKKTLDLLEQSGYKLGFITNNSSLSREGFRSKFKKLGFQPTNYYINNSAYGAARYISQKGMSRVFVIGESGLQEELQLQGIYVTEKYEEGLQAVCIGWDRGLTWYKLADAMHVILHDNGSFIATNPDNSFPYEDRLVPGAGAGIAALSNACAKEPDIIIGKPNRFLIDLALSEMECKEPKNALLVGDRLSTDILAGINAGIDTVLVKTGVNDIHLNGKVLPKYELDSIIEIFSILK